MVLAREYASTTVCTMQAKAAAVRFVVPFGDMPRARTFVQREHILHAREVFRIQLKNAPQFFLATA